MAPRSSLAVQKFFLPYGALGVCLALAATLLVGCGTVNEEVVTKPQTYSGTYPIRAVATVGMVADLVREIGGDHIQVAQIMGAGVDPHLYNPSRDDVSAIMNSDITFFNGLLLEGKMQSILEDPSLQHPVVAIAEHLTDSGQLIASTDEPGHYDPHVWMDVALWSRCAESIRDALMRFDPKHRDDYQSRCEQLQQQMQQLDQYGTEVVGSIPTDSRILITSHDAFSYFGRKYGIEVRGIQGISTESEAGLQRINELVDLLVERKVPAVFVESSVPRKSVEALVDGARSRQHTVRICGPLFSDAMGKTGTYEGTYLGMLDHNFTLVAQSLGGTAPEKGWQGKLNQVTEAE